MRLLVKVKANSRVSSIEKSDSGEFILRVKSPAIEGRANLAVVELLSEHFGLPKSRISIIRGLKSKTKLVEIEDRSV